MRRQTLTTATVAVLLGALVTACGSSPPASPGATDSPPVGTSAATPSETTTSTPSVEADPDKAAVMQAYLDFSSSLAVALAHPAADGRPKGGDFTAHSFDPARQQVDALLQSLVDSGLEFRGTPPNARAQLQSMDMTAAPHPTAVLTDCTYSASWVPFEIKSGKPQVVPVATPPPPYERTLTLIFHEKHWGVYKIDSDTSRTCTP